MLKLYEQKKQKFYFVVNKLSYFCYSTNFQDPKKVQEIRKKCEKMISLVGSEDNSVLSSILLEDKENVNKMNDLIKILCHLSMFYTYNTNWDNKNLPGYSKIDSKLLDEPIKSRSPTKYTLGRIEAHTFHLSMPYTNEVKIISIIFINLLFT